MTATVASGANMSTFTKTVTGVARIMSFTVTTSIVTGSTVASSMRVDVFLTKSGPCGRTTGEGLFISITTGLCGRTTGDGLTVVTGPCGRTTGDGITRFEIG